MREDRVASRCTILLEARAPVRPAGTATTSGSGCDARPTPPTSSAPRFTISNRMERSPPLDAVPRLFCSLCPTHPPSGSHARRSSARAFRREQLNGPSSSAWASPPPRRCSTSSSPRPARPPLDQQALCLVWLDSPLLYSQMKQTSWSSEADSAIAPTLPEEWVPRARVAARLGALKGERKRGIWSFSLSFLKQTTVCLARKRSCACFFVGNHLFRVGRAGEP